MLSPDPEAPLRQGDVCLLPHVPIWNLPRSGVLSGAFEGMVQMPTWEKIQRHEGQCLVTIASQCCDLENPKARTGVLLAPLMKIPAAPRDPRYPAIMASGTPNEQGSYAYVHLFPFELGGEVNQDVVADLSALTTMAPSAVAAESLRESRLFSLDNETRRRFRTKLAFMFGRDPDLKPNPD